jgi:putative DNA primase/helicase
VIKFKDFNTLYNRLDEPIYTVLRNSEPVGSRIMLKSYNEILKLAALEPSMELGWLLPKEYMLIELTNKCVVETIKNNNEPALIIEDQNKHLYYVIVEYNGKNTDNNLLGCGVLCNTRITTARKSTIIPLPFKPPGNTSVVVSKLHLYHHNGIMPPDPWLKPLFSTGKKTINHGIELPSAEPSTDLRKLLMVFKHSLMSSKEQESIIHFVNTHMITIPLTKDEVEDVLVAGYIKSTDFFDPIDNRFYHDVMGEYLIKEHYIKLEDNTNKLHYWDEEALIYKHDDKHLLHYMTKLVPTLRTHQKEEVLEYMQQILYPERVRFNANPLSICFNNGLLDIRTKTFTKMNPSLLETIKIQANYNPSASSKLVDEFFENLTTGVTEIEQLFYEAIGYSMLKTNRLQKAFIMVGGGRNGKSTFQTLLREVLGVHNVTSLSFKDLANNFRAASATGKLATLAGDISSQKIQDSDMVKSMIGGDLVKVEHKFKDSYDTEMFATMWFSANKLPRTPDTSDGFYRRFCIIPMKANLSKISKVQGEMFTEKLIHQNNLDYVATKAAEAIFNLYHVTEDFILPDEVKQMMEDYKILNSSVLSWASDVYQSTISKFITKDIKRLYDEYDVWCETNNFSPVRSSRFRDEIEEEFELVVDIEGNITYAITEEDTRETTSIIDTTAQ